MKKYLSLVLAIIMVAAVFCTALPFSAFAAEDDIVAEIWLEGAETPAFQITRGDFVSSFPTSKNGNFAAGLGNVTIKLLADIDVGEAQCGFYTEAGATVILDGDPDGDGVNAKITGSNTSNPALRVYGTNGGKFIFKNVDYEKTVNNMLQFYNNVEVDLVGCNWTSGGNGFCPSGSGTVNIKEGTTVSAKGNVIFGNWAVNGANKTNVFNVEAGATIVALAEAPVISVPACSHANVVVEINVNGATIEGDVSIKHGTLALNAGALTGALTVVAPATVAKADGFTVGGAVDTPAGSPEVTTPAETTPAETQKPEEPATPTDPKPAEGKPEDVILEVYNADTNTLIKKITRGEFLDLFPNGKDAFATDPDFAGKNLRVEVMNDLIIPNGDQQISFSAAGETTLTVNGNGHLFYGGKGGNPVIRFHGPGKIVLNKLNLYHKGGSCVQYYSNATLDINECTWTTPDHYVFFNTNSGTVNINDKTVLQGSKVIHYTSSGQNTININPGSTLIGTGTDTIALENGAKGAELNLLGGLVKTAKEDGNAINDKSGYIGNIVTIRGSAVIGDIIGTSSSIMMFESGSLTGEYDGGVEPIITGGFVINGEAYVETTPVETTPEETPAETPAETTPAETTPEETEPAVVTTPEATEPAAPTTGGCGGFSVAAQLVALICAAGALIIIKKK